MARWSELRPSNSSCKASLTESVVVEFNKAIVLLVRPGRLSRARNDDGPSMRRTAARPCSRSVVVVALAHTTCSSFVTRDRYTPLDGRHLIRPTRQCISPQRLYDGDQQLRVEQDQQALASKPGMLAHCNRNDPCVTGTDIFLSIFDPGLISLEGYQATMTAGYGQSGNRCAPIPCVAPDEISHAVGILIIPEEAVT